MRHFSIAALLLLAASVWVSAQPKAVHFKKLQNFLPAGPVAGFERQKPTGSTQTQMGLSTSDASVQFVKKDSVMDQSIMVKVSDMVSVGPSFAVVFQQQEYSNESEDGYEKSALVGKRYRALEKGSTGEMKSCELRFAVASRFLVELEASGFCDGKVLLALAESMPLEKLETTEP